MTEREQFRFAMLTVLAREGLTPPQAVERVKSAMANWILPFFKWPAYALPLAVAGGAVGGAALGHFTAKAMEKDIDPEEIRRQELVAAYQQHTDRIRRNIRRMYRENQAARPTGGIDNGL